MSLFIDSIRAELKTRRCSLQTEKVYLSWIRAFIRFHQKQHPSELYNEHIEQFLSHLAVNRQVSAATQNQALIWLKMHHGNTFSHHQPDANIHMMVMFVGIISTKRRIASNCEQR